MRPGTVVYVFVWLLALIGIPAAAEHDPNWKNYTNARFGFSVQYPADWRPGEALPDGSGIVLTPPVQKCQVGLTSFLNLVEGKSQDGRQTLDEFAAAHRRIMGEYYSKKNISLRWQEDLSVTLGGLPARQLSFSYLDETKTEIIELHIFSLGRNEGRGVRMKFPATSRSTLMPVLANMLQTYQPGRDQNAVSPFSNQPAPRRKDRDANRPYNFSSRESAVAPPPSSIAFAGIFT